MITVSYIKTYTIPMTNPDKKLDHKKVYYPDGQVVVEP